jgi:hypothetical protein
MSKIIFLSIMPMQVYNTLLGSRMGTEPPLRGPGCLSLTFFMLMVGAPESLSSAPRGPSSTFLSVDGGHSRISSSGTSHGAHHRRFLALLVGAPQSPAPAPPRGPTVDVFYVDGGCS